MKPWYKKWWGIGIFFLVFIFLSAIFAFLLLVMDIRQDAGSGQSTHLLASAKMPAKIIGTEKNYWTGSADPKITIVEFGDFACHYCQKSFSKIREISRNNSKNIKFIFRDYPVISEFSPRLALAARCAGEQGLFWVMHDKLFLNQGIKDDENVLSLFSQIGGDQERFQACYKNNKYLPDVEKDLLDGQALSISGTPTWFINGQRLEGDVPYEYFINLINNILKIN